MLDFLISSPVDRLAAVTSALVSNAPWISSHTPCHLKSVADISVSDGVVPSTEIATNIMLASFHEYPHIFIVEKELGLGYFLVFYYHESLNVISNGEYACKISKEPQNSSDLLDYPDSMNEMQQLTKSIEHGVAHPSALELIASKRFKSVLDEAPLTLVCGSEDYSACKAAYAKTGKRGAPPCSSKIHSEKVILPHTDHTLGDCSYLDTCFKGKQCKFVHYRILYPSEPVHYSLATDEKLPAAQYLNANLSKLDLSSLGDSYKALIIDPPWDIHTNPNFDGGCSDADFQKSNIKISQKEGIIFLWVTGRVLDLGRKCSTDWGYANIEEVLWLKTNQLGRMICTGRTGHWLNHTKEHLLVGTKGNVVPPFRRMMEVDVLVSNALGKSQKPIELYAIIDRLVGKHAPKLELFGRPSNVRPGWITIGNEFQNTQLTDPELKTRLLPALLGRAYS